jgi:putative nucleotidyltransferase with HDIG domain
VDVNVRLLALRLAAGALTLFLVPAVVVLGTLRDEAPLVVGQESPRTIESDRFVRVEDAVATLDARVAAQLAVQPVETLDLDAQRETIADVRAVFVAVRLARVPVELIGTPSDTSTVPPTTPLTTSRVPTEVAQLETLRAQVEALEDAGLMELIALGDVRLNQVEADVIAIVQSLAGQRMTADEVPVVLDQQLPTELALRSWPGAVAADVAAPLVREVLRATVTIDTVETARRQQEAEDAVEPILRQWDSGDTVVEAGDMVTDVQFIALVQLGEAGSEPGVAFARAFLAMLLVTSIVAMYLVRSQPTIWKDPSRLFVLASVVVLSAVLLYAVKVLADTFGTGWWFAFPVGGIVLLVAVLTTPETGTASVLPLGAVALLVAPAVPALAIFITAIVVLAAPMTAWISTRVGLRRASLRVAIAAPIVAGIVAVVFGPRDQVPVVLLAAAVGGLANIGLLQGLLPAFETIFRLATVTALLDLADRNHPLLRELETKAMGSYNHSVMVSSLTERCCREIGANHLLGQVAALYHDIGKVRQPHFFIENQRGIANPHDDTTARQSAVIIQNHVKDGVEMAVEHRLPPDVVDCIQSHHGTMLVTYFYRQAIDEAGGDEAAVDEAHFRYKGHKPRSKEAAVLLLADCCEATTRAMAMDRGTLPSELIEATVDKLLHERVEDGQFDDCALTFVELNIVRDTLVDALTGIYHPRIAYPGRGTASPAAR